MDSPAQRSLPARETSSTVLVVDDEPAIREVVAEVLKDHGYVVRQAADGRQALAVMARDDVDLVLSDVQMPHLDGAALAHRIRRHGHTVPVVLMSANHVEGDLPGVGFLPKPFALDRLVHVIGAALSAHR
jgi:CheY-like chemotaxis protein